MLLPLVELICVAARSGVSNLMPDVTGRRPTDQKLVLLAQRAFLYAELVFHCSLLFAELPYTDIAESVSQERTLAGARCRGLFQQ